MSYRRISSAEANQQPQSLGATRGFVRQRRRAAMGDISALDVANVFAAASDVSSAMHDAVADPYLPSVIQSVIELDATENRQPWPLPDRGQNVVNQLRGVFSPTPGSSGVGLGPVATALKGYVYAKQIPFGVPIAIGLLLGIPFLIGRAMR